MSLHLRCFTLNKSQGQLWSLLSCLTFAALLEAFFCIRTELGWICRTACSGLTKISIMSVSVTTCQFWELRSYYIYMASFKITQKKQNSCVSLCSQFMFMQSSRNRINRISISIFNTHWTLQEEQSRC